jgi:two-component system nitrogen regulation sensor histidine kinase NtrY
MASRLPSTSWFALGLTIRALVVGVLSFGAIELLTVNRLYATALVLLGIAALVTLDLTRAVGRADRELGRFVDDLAAESFDRSGVGAAGFRAMSMAIDRAATKLQSMRVERQRHTDYLQTLVDSVAAALFVTRRDGTITLANHAAQKLAGQSVRHLSEIELIGPQSAALLRDLAPGGREIIRLTDGRSMLASALQFSTPGGERQRLISLQDIAVELAAVELKAWQDLVRILAHEIMNSLTPISSLAESIQAMLQASPGSGAAQDPAMADVSAAVEVVARRSAGLMSFVDRYRKVAELPRPDLQPVALRAFVDGIDRLMSAVFQARGVSYRSRIEPDNLVVNADASLLEQAVINLLRNALDAVQDTPQPAVSLICAPQGEFIAISVADNGPGLSDEIKDKLFLPFFTTKPGGSGIGLSIARQVALAHHGQIEARSRKGGGTEFVLSLTPPFMSG